MLHEGHSQEDPHLHLVGLPDTVMTPQQEATFSEYLVPQLLFCSAGLEEQQEDLEDWTEDCLD